MARRIKVNSGISRIVLPDGRMYDGPVEVVLTDEQFYDIRASLFPDVLMDLGPESSEAGAVEKMPWFLYGHSMVAGDIMNTVGARFVDRVKDRLNLGTVTNRAVNGATAQDMSGRLIGTGAPFVAGTKGIVLLVAGGNEAIATPNTPLTTVQKTSIEENIRACIHACMVASRDEVRAPSGWTFSGTWTESTANTLVSAQNNAVTTVQGAYATKTLTAGQYVVDIGTVPGAAATAEIIVGGTVVHTVQTGGVTYDNNGGPSGHTSRIITVPEGGAEVRIRKSDATTNGLYPDYIGPVRAKLPVVLLMREALGSDGLNPQISKAQNDEINAIYDTLYAEFPWVYEVDPRQGFSQTTMVGSDGIHINDFGQDHYADVVEAVLRTVPFDTGLNT